MVATLALVRWLHYSAAMLLFGGATMAWVVTPPALAAAWAGPLRRLFVGCAGVLLLTSVGWLMLEAGSFGDGWGDVVQWDTIQSVALDTEFGRTWLAHGALVIVLLVVLLADRRGWVAPMAGLVLASLGLIGHAAMQAGPVGWGHRANLALHLLAAGFWVGGLVPLLPWLRRLNNPSQRHDAGVALRRFSRIGHGAVALVVLTGVINLVLIRGAAPLDWGSPYLRLLAAKVALVLVMIALALHNRYGLVPRLRDSPAARDCLWRNSVLELLLAGTAVALVSLLGLLDPM